MHNEQKKMTELEYSTLIREQCRHFSRNMITDKSTIYIPSSKGLWEKTPGSLFHLGFELFFQISGSCIFDFPSQRIIINPDDILLVPPGLPHHETALNHGRDIFRNMVYMLGETNASVHIAQMKNSLPQKSSSDILFPIHQEPLNSTKFYLEILKAIMQIPADNRPESRALRQRLLDCILLQSLIELEEPKAINSWPSQIQLSGKKHYKVALAKKIIHEHIMSTMPSVSELAETVKCSPNHLSSLFHEITGMTVKNYANDLKLEYARKLIETTTYNISEIAWSCGFADSAYFAKLFKRKFGMTPADIRSAPTGKTSRIISEANV